MKRTPLAALALLMAVVCVGCSDDPEPDFAPPESTSPAPTDPTTSATTPVKLSPEETVRAWVEARNVTIQDGSTDAVYALSTANCKTCRDLVEPVADVYRRGGRYETSGWKVEGAKARPNFDSNHEVTAAVEYAAGKTFHDATAAPVSYEAEHHILFFGLTRESGVWKVRQILYAS